MEFVRESEELKRSNWPKCDVLADSLASNGIKAAPALILALESKTKHVRSACLRALASVDGDIARLEAQKYIKDKAYEVREAAAKILGVPVP